MVSDFNINYCYNKDDMPLTTSTSVGTTQTSSKNKPNYVELVDQEAIEFNHDHCQINNNKEIKNLNDLLTSVKQELNSSGAKLTDEEILEILAYVTQKKLEDLEKLESKELKKLTDLLVQTVHYMRKNKEEISFDSVQRKARDYQMVINAGYDSVEEFEKKNSKKSLDELSRAWSTRWNCFINFDWHITEKGRRLDYFKTIVRTAKKIDDPDARNTYLKTAIVSLIYNTPEEDRQAIIDFAKNQEAKGIDQTILDAINCFDNQKYKTEAADSITPEDVRRIVENSGYETPEEAAEAAGGFQRGVTGSQSDKGVKETEQSLQANCKKFYEENAESIINIIDKNTKGIELTAEEQEIWNQKLLYDKQLGGFAKGLFENTVASKEVLEGAIDTTLTTITETPGAENIIADVRQFTEENKENLRFTEDEVNAIFKENNIPPAKQNSEQAQTNTTEQASIGFTQKENVNNNTNVNNNNAEVASTASVIDTPVQAESTNNRSVALGFTATAPKVDTTRLDSISQTITAQTTEAVKAENQAEEVVVTKTTSFIKALQIGKEGVEQFFAENGTIKAVTAVFNNFSQISDQSIITKALQLYKGLSSTEQADILVNAKNGALVELINNSDANALAQCQGETASNFWATKKINEAAEKALEKQA